MQPPQQRLVIFQRVDAVTVEAPQVTGPGAVGPRP
jgi:hypothetical protein